MRLETIIGEPPAAPPLPFPNLYVPKRHLLWLIMANAGDYPEKYSWFYPFKTRFLKAHAISDGYDLQVIERKCWCGDGIFRGIEGTRPPQYWDTCWKCNGTKIYRIDRIVLSRWDCNGVIFHCPENRVCGPTHYHQNIIRGLVKHEKIAPDSHAARAFRRLLLRYEPRTLWNLETARLKAHGRAVSWKLRHTWRLLETRMQEDAGTRYPESDYTNDIPF